MQPWNPRGINPALMTQREYYQLANPHGKTHSERSYDVGVNDLNRYDIDMGDYNLINQVTINNIVFRIMVKREKHRYAMHGPDGEYIRINGELLFYSDDQIEQLGMKPYSYVISAFDGTTRVAAVQDEWGAMLIRVAREYRNFGLGTLLGKLARTFEPDKSSGGFTPSGSKNFSRVHAEFVRDALKSGLYSDLVRSGKITTQRVKEIISSIGSRIKKISLPPPKPMLYADGHGAFILYDGNLKEALENNQSDYLIDRMIWGYVYVMPDDRNGITRIKQFGARDAKTKAVMLSLAYSASDLPLWVESDEYDIEGFQYGEESRKFGYLSREILSGPKIDYRGFVNTEKRFRSFDQYGEFENELQELALGKFQ